MAYGLRRAGVLLIRRPGVPQPHLSPGDYFLAS
jgi:hypothetical protein